MIEDMQSVRVYIKNSRYGWVLEFIKKNTLFHHHLHRIQALNMKTRQIDIRETHDRPSSSSIYRAEPGKDHSSTFRPFTETKIFSQS